MKTFTAGGWRMCMIWESWILVTPVTWHRRRREGVEVYFYPLWISALDGMCVERSGRLDSWKEPQYIVEVPE